MGEPTVAERSLLRALGQEIRAARGRAEMTRADLAAAAGVSETTIGRIEREGPVDFGDSLRIATELKVDIVWLLQRAEAVIELSGEWAARDTGAVSEGQRRRRAADQAGEPGADDPEDLEPR